jgi:hypothetical protein
MTTKYDPEVVQRFADRLYARTVSTIVISTLLGSFIGIVVDPFAQQALPQWLSDHLPPWSIPVVLGIAGLIQGLERSFLLKIQAQTALCQMQIELNTRREEPVPPTAP